LTGETEPSRKISDAVSTEIPGRNDINSVTKANLAFMGTLVRCGSGKVIFCQWTSRLCCIFYQWLPMGVTGYFCTTCHFWDGGYIFLIKQREIESLPVKSCLKNFALLMVQNFIQKNFQYLNITFIGIICKYRVPK